ncbi:hypothetical protein [Antarcticirhabdus aurantiaca]|uniref:Uncharacterized protein n=1 Tax=Antarcticirhabdus aurantiaca TaxID=2606717 RepID=A0ACD4NJF6_9HYPH|nr:hypothetical protein OXU80_18470 [Jeongeuplla avenae]
MVEQLVRTEVVTETSGRPGKPGVSVVAVAAVQASDGTVTLTFTMSDGETHVVTFRAGEGGTLPDELQLAGQALGRALASAALSASLDLSGRAAASAIAAAPVLAELALAGTAAGKAVTTASLAASLALSGAATGRASTQAQASPVLELSGSTVGRAQASGIVTIGDELTLGGAAVGRGSATAAALLELTVAGTAAVRAGASGALAAALDVSGTASGRASAVGALAASIALAGSATGLGRATGAATLTAPAAFNVLALGPSMWIDASDAASLSLVDGKVQQASDKSGNARHAMQATAANQPSYLASHTVANNKPAFFNTSATGRLENDAGITVPIEEIYIVAAFATGAEAVFNTSSVGWGDGYAALFSGYGSNGMPRQMGLVNTGDFISSNAFAMGGFRNRETTVRGIGGTGVPSMLPLPLSVLRFQRQASAPLDSRRCLMAQGAQRAWNGPYCEAVAFPAALSDADRGRLIEHLIAKWAIVA